MISLKKKTVMTPEQKQIQELKNEVRHCEQQIKCAQALFEFATDENLIEARIYEIKSLIKHHDYLINTIKNIMASEQENKTVEV